MTLICLNRNHLKDILPNNLNKDTLYFIPDGDLSDGKGKLPALLP